MALRVDHIGSTSVPGLGAKNVIDIQVTVAALTLQIPQRLVRAGYRYWESITHLHIPKGDDDNPKLWEKLLFSQPERERRSNVHVRADGNPDLKYPLLVRD